MNRHLFKEALRNFLVLHHYGDYDVYVDNFIATELTLDELTDCLVSMRLHVDCFKFEPCIRFARDKLHELLASKGYDVPVKYQANKGYYVILCETNEEN